MTFIELLWELFLWSIGLGLIVILVILVLKIVPESNATSSAVVRFYYRLVPLENPPEDLMEHLHLELGKRGVYNVLSDDGLVIDDVIYWRLSLQEYSSGKCISVEAGVKTWYLILTIIGVFLFFVAGVALGLLAYLRFVEKRDVIRSVLTTITGDPRLAAQL